MRKTIVLLTGMLMLSVTLPADGGINPYLLY